MAVEDETSPIVHIDKFHLDDEWERQADLMKQYGDMMAKAKERVATLNATLKVRTAEIKLDIRSNPEKYGLEKVTEATVEEASTVNGDVQAITQAIIKAKYKQDLIDSTLNALSHKKAALENEVYLWGASYFSKPTKIDPGKIAGRKTTRGTHD